MTAEVINFIDSVINNDNEKAKESFSCIFRDKIAEQLELFSKPEESSPSKRYLIKPIGLSYDDIDYARQVANKNKGVIIDTETGKEIK